MSGYKVSKNKLLLIKRQNLCYIVIKIHRKYYQKCKKESWINSRCTCRKIEMCEKNIGNIENGKQFPQVDNFLRLIEVLNISLDEFGVKHCTKVNEVQEELIKLVLNSTEEMNTKYLKTIRFIDNIIEK